MRILDSFAVAAMSTIAGVSLATFLFLLVLSCL